MRMSAIERRCSRRRSDAGKRAHSTVAMVLGAMLVLSVTSGGAQSEATGESSPSELSKAGERFRAVLESTQPLLLDGRIDAAVEAIEKAVPEASRTPWEDLFLANVLYDLEPKRSLALHERAYARLPDSPDAALELGLEQHRAGKCAEAVPLYRAVLLARPDEAPLQALIAECLVAAGDLPGAVAAWEAAGHASHHTGIDFMIFAVHGELSPWRRRADLLASARAGDRGAAVRLIALDLRFDQDWWNAERQDDALAHDKAELARLLGDESREWKEIQAGIELADVRTAEEARGILKKAGLLLSPDGNLPLRDELTLQIVPTILGLELESGEALLARFGKEFEARAFAEPGSPAAADLLLGLQPEANAEAAAQLERRAWEKFHQPRFAAAHLALLQNLQRLRFDAEALQAARREFPRDANIAGMAYEVAQRDKAPAAEVQGALVAAILAEFTKLTGAYGQSDSYRLKGYFAELRDRVAASRP